jgi:hypothetical protein
MKIGQTVMKRIDDNIIRLGSGQKLHRQFTGVVPAVCNGQNRRLQIVDVATPETLENHKNKLCAKCWNHVFEEGNDGHQN